MLLRGISSLPEDSLAPGLGDGGARFGIFLGGGLVVGAFGEEEEASDEEETRVHFFPLALGGMAAGAWFRLKVVQLMNQR